MLLRKTWVLALLFFGLTSLLADVCYEGFRSVLGPLAFRFRGGWLDLGLVVAEGELLNWGLRLPMGYLADALRAWWLLTFIGYALTPLGVLVATLGGSITFLALGVGLERFGKTIRSPARDALLAGLSGRRGLIYSIHEVLDQVGAVAGPLLATALLACGTVHLLAVPGLAALAALALAKITYPESEVVAARRGLPRLTWRHSTFFLVGLVSFITPNPVIVAACYGSLYGQTFTPIAYMVVMLVDALFALPLGKLYDYAGRLSLLVAPAAGLASALFMVLKLPLYACIACGISIAAFETVYKAYVADKALATERATCFGIYSLGFGLGQAVSAILYSLLALTVYPSSF